MNTMRFLNQNKLWVNIFAIMNNKSDAAWWLMEHILYDKIHLEAIQKQMSLMDLEMSKNLCELYPEYILWDELSRNTAEWAVNILSKNLEKINKRMFYKTHVLNNRCCSDINCYLSRPLNVRNILKVFKEDFDLIEKKVTEESEQQEIKRRSNPNGWIDWDKMSKNPGIAPRCHMCGV